MSATIKLCLYGTPRNAIPSLTGRSGKVHARAHFNEREQRHETPEFDLDDYQKAIHPDIVKFPSTLRWWPLVTVEAEGEEVKRLKAELAEARAQIAELQAQQTNAKDVDPFAGLATGIARAGELTPGTTGETASEKPLAELSYRDLRAMCKEREIATPVGITKEDMIALLTKPAEEPAAT